VNLITPTFLPKIFIFSLCVVYGSFWDIDQFFFHQLSTQLNLKLYQKMPEINDNILRCLFSKRYMDFKTCSALRPVSVQFHRFATEYCLSLREFDFSVMTKDFVEFDFPGRVADVHYPCLAEAVAKYCPNLKRIRGVRAETEKLFRASRDCFNQLPHLNSVAFDDEQVELTIVNHS